MISQARIGDDQALLGKIVDGNSPFELKPASSYTSGGSKAGDSTSGLDKKYRRGILLIHGLTDSPYSVRYLAAFFQEQGFRVMAILLPGHGTQPGDLLEVTWQEWIKAVSYGVEMLASEVDEVYLGGLSTGAALSILHSQRDDRIRGQFLFSPALEVSQKAAYANFHKLYSWLIPSAKWVNIMPDRDIYKYESFPKNAAAQIHSLIREINCQEKVVSIPVFIAASEDDATVNSEAILRFFACTEHRNSRMVLYSTDTHNISPKIFGGISGGILEEKLEMVNSVIPDKRILSAAHTSIIVPPDDAYYGEHGDYVNCIHYYPDERERYAACMENPESAYLGEITSNNLQAGLLRRLMYNPNFDALKASMCRFIESLP
ncbi:MAG: alpha/beta fold hydrolase [Gallionella sp.]